MRSLLTTHCVTTPPPRLLPPLPLPQRQPRAEQPVSDLLPLCVCDPHTPSDD